MPNHFHLAVRVKSEEHILKLINHQKINNFISKKFSNLFSSYTQSFNKVTNRKGTLFEKPFKRINIDNNEYLYNLINYIHRNPVHHGFVKDLRDWKYSSFNSFFSKRKTLLKRKEVIELFDGKYNFLLSHKKELNEKIILEIVF